MNRNRRAGTPITFLTAAGKELLGIVENILDEGETKYLRVQITTETKRHGRPQFQLLPQEHWSRVRTISEIKLPPAPKPKVVEERYRLAADVIESENVGNFYEFPGNDCLLICGYGRLKNAENEIRHAPFTSGNCSNGGSHVGVLQEILQVKGYCKKEDSPKSQIWSTAAVRARLNSMRSNVDPIPKLVIFDGASAYSRWRSFFGNSNQIVVLDRTDPNYEEGVLSFGGEFTLRDPKYDNDWILECPKGIDITHFVGRKV